MTTAQLAESSGFVRTPTGLKAIVYKTLYISGEIHARIRYWDSDKLADVSLSKLVPWEGKP